MALGKWLTREEVLVGVSLLSNSWGIDNTSRYPELSSTEHLSFLNS